MHIGADPSGPMCTMKTAFLLAVALALAGLAFVPGASAADCGGLVDVTCEYDDHGTQKSCVLWTDADAPDVPNCLVGG